MGITASNKTISTNEINCGENFDITLSLTAEPEIISNPTDIVLILDRSGSLSGDPFTYMKNGAKKFIDIIDQATDSQADGQIGFGSRIGIVSFADDAVENTQLITSVDDLKNAVDSLNNGGRTNHYDAFTKAVDLFDQNSNNAKVMVMFTDGKTTVGPSPSPITDSAKANGAIIYCIGLESTGGLDQDALEDWASKPSSTYVSIAPDDTQLEELFEDLAKNIAKPGATQIVINETVMPDFQITAIKSTTKGSATLLNNHALKWELDELGALATENAQLVFTVQHIGSQSGMQPVNETILYNDEEQHTVSFPSPEIMVNCDIIVQPEPCPTPVDVTIDRCVDALQFDAGDLMLDGLGRILQLDVTLKNVCPHRRVALAVILTEVDYHHVEYQRGMKIFTIPAHSYRSCKDILIRCINFVLPEDLDPSGNTNSICNRRKFKAKFIAHYIDNDFECCDI